MMIVNKKRFFLGAGLMAGFAVVFVMIFIPLFNGQNGLEYLDSLYNSISKGSAYYIPQLKEDVAAFSDKNIDVTLETASAQQAEQMAKLFHQGGAGVKVSGSRLQVSGNLGGILMNCLDDADSMYQNLADKIKTKYQYDERRVLYNWWVAATEMDKALSRQKLFKEAKMVSTVKKKAVETAYNYYKIEPQKISDKVGIVIFSLLFYVIYTLWYGFSLMFMFEGWGMRLEH